MKKIIFLAIAMLTINFYASSRDIIVGVKVQPPFIIEDIHETHYSGICIDILERSFPNDSLIFQKYDSYNQLIHACEKNDIDIIASNITMLPDRQNKIDFSMPYFTSQLGIVSQIIKISWYEKAGKLLKLLGQFYLVFILLGSIIFIFEKDKNEAFKDANGDNKRDIRDYIIGILDGTYYSFIVGSTIGFGDITPKTLVGKFFTMFIFFASVSFLTFFVNNLWEIIEEEDASIEQFSQLKGYNVSCQEGTTTKEFLIENGIPISESVKLVEQGIINTMGDPSKVFVDEKPIQEYYLYKNGLKGKLKVYSNDFMEQLYGFGVPEKNSNKDYILEAVNKNILELRLSKEIQEISARYGI